MTGNVSRVLDSIIIGEETTAGTEASSYNIDLLGDIINCSLKTTENNQVLGGIQGGSTGGHLPSKIVNLSATPVGSVTFHPHTLEFYKYVISDFTSDSSSYTMNNNSALMPKSLSIKGNYDNTKGVKYLGCYLNNVRFSLADNNIVSYTADIVALYSTNTSETVAYTAPAGSPLTYVGGVFTFDGNEWDLQSFNNSYNCKFTQKFGLNTKASGKKRYPSSIYRGGKAVISFDGVCNIEDITDELQLAQGGTDVADYKNNSSLIMTMEDNDGETHTITITGQINEPEITQTDSEETNKTMTFSGVGVDFTVAGTK